MNPDIFCQSCTMPIDNVNDRGTEKDGSTSNDYCKYCYQSGAFTDPDMTYDKMRSDITSRMQQMNLPENIINGSLQLLPDLKRWKKIKA